MRRKYKKKAKVRHVFFFVILTALLFIVLYYYFSIRPLLEEFVNEELANHINLTISRITSDEIAENNVTYDSLVLLTKDDSGRITSLSTQVGNMNKLKLDIERKLLETFLKTEHITIEVPIGSLLGGEFLSGRGPCIKVRAVPMTRVYTEYKNEFDGTGINQTRHRILLNYSVSLKILLPGKREKTEIKNQILISETVIIGNVPNFYSGK